MNPEPAKSRESDIEFLLLALSELQVQLDNCYKIILSIKDDPELKETYARETIPLEMDFALLSDELKSCLEEHFQFEKETGAPVRLDFRKLYKGFVK